MIHKSSSFNGLLNGEGLQGRWRQTNATSFIRRKSKFRFHFVYLIATVLLILIVYVSLPPTKKGFSSSYIEPTSAICGNIISYNSTYPLTKPIVNPHNHHTVYRIAIIADLDTNSKRDKAQSSYSSFYKRGYLTIGPSQSTFEFKWDAEDSTEITSGYALKGKDSKQSSSHSYLARIKKHVMNIFL